jgi:hypothetical protein
MSSNYYPPLRVDSSVPDDIIRQSLRKLSRMCEVVGKIEDNGVFKTVYFDEEEELDLLEDSLWLVLDYLEAHGALMIFKDCESLALHSDDSCVEGDWYVDGFNTWKGEVYEKHYLFKATYLDNNVKGIRRDEYEDMPEGGWVVGQAPVEVSVTVEATVNTTPKKPKKSWFSRVTRLFR